MPFLKIEQGIKLYYEKHGNAGPIIVLLPGLASTTRIWIQQIRTLRNQCQVYTLDFPGHGRSDWQHHYSLSEFSEYLRSLLDELAISEVSLVAISIGCSIALIFSERYPERVNKLVLEGPIGGYHSWWNPLGWQDWLVFGLLPLILQVSIHLFGYHATAHWLNTFGVHAKRNLKVLESVQHQADFKAIRELLWDSACAPYVGQLEKITAPVLLIRGQQDPMPKRFVNYIRANLRHVTFLEVPECRHLVAIERPNQFNRAIIDFLNLTPVIGKSE